MPNGDIEAAALRLLRALNENQAKDRVGAMVMPDMKVAKDAGLEYGFTPYEAALSWLLDTGALVTDEATNQRMRNIVGTPEHGWAFLMTSTGLDMLR